MWNDEELNTIVIRNRKGKIIAEIDVNNLTCDNRKFPVKPGWWEDAIEIQLNQNTYS